MKKIISFILTISLVMSVLVFSAVPASAAAETVILSFDSTANFVAQWETASPAVETTNKTQGSGSMRMGFNQPVKDSPYVGGMLIYDYATAQDFSGYQSFKIDLYTPQAMTGNGGTFQINFVGNTSAQDGFNFDINISTLNAGWNTLTIPNKDNPNANVNNFSWSSIKRIRFTWFNTHQIERAFFLLDSLKGCVPEKEVAHEPYAVGDDLMIHDADSLVGWKSAFNTTVEVCPQHIQGTGAAMITSTIPVGQTANVGAMGYIDIPVTDLSSYNAFSFKFRLHHVLTDDAANGSHFFQINFCDTSISSDDGFNYSFKIGGNKAWWSHVVIEKSAFQKAYSNIDWSSIDRIRLTWFNNAKENINTHFSFDEFLAHVETPEAIEPELAPDPTKAALPVVLEDGSLMISGVEDDKGWTSAFATSVKTAYKVDKGNTTGTKSMALISKTPIGQNANVGAMGFLSFCQSFSLADYDTISIKFYISSEYEGEQAFGINFCSPGNDQDGFNYEFDISKFPCGRWYNLVIKKSDFDQRLDTADWSRINRIRFTWFNVAQADIYDETFYIDDIKAYPADCENIPDDSLDLCPYEFGDIDEDGAVNTSDALLVLQHVARKSTLSDYQQYLADVCKPDGITSSDALVILQRTISKIDDFATDGKASYVSQYESYEPDPVTVPDSVIKNNAYNKDGDDGSDKSFVTTTLGIKPRTMYVLSPSVVLKSLQHKRLVYSLQGLVNRDFGIDEEHSSIIYVENDASDNSWREYLLNSETGPFYAGTNGDRFNVVQINSWFLFYKTFKPVIEQCGYITWDPNVPATANVAATICGLDGYLPVMDGSGLEAELTERGIEERMTLVGKFTGSTTGSKKNDAYRWALDNYFSRCSYDYIAYTTDGAAEVSGNPVNLDGDSFTHGYCIENHDYLIARRAFFIDLNPYSGDRPEDSSSASAGLDLATFKLVLDRRYSRAGGKYGAFMGFIPWWIKYASDCGNSTAGAKPSYYLEWLLSEILACYNLGKEADAAFPCSMTNGSVYYKYTVADELVNKNKPEYTGSTKVTSYNSSVHYYTIYVGDYDSSAWVKKHMSTMWGDVNRGKIDLMWSINPNLAYRVPMIFEYMYDNLSDCDYMAAGEGAGYSIPTGLVSGSTPRYYGSTRPSSYASGIDAYKTYAKKMYDMCDMDITGFLIMGANNLSTSVASAYSYFSPTAVFHQAPAGSSTTTNWNFAMYGSTPFIVCRQDSLYYEDDYATRNSGLYSHAFTAMGSYGFSCFRTVCETPTEIKGSVEDFNAYCATKGKSVQYVDPYSLVYLAKNNASSKFLKKG